MSAGLRLQKALIGALRDQSELTGVFDGPPARAPFPYAVVDCCSESNWSVKDRRGREIAASVTVWDEQPVRMHDLADRMEATLQEPLHVDQWDVAGWRFIGRRPNRDADGPWSLKLEFRARLFEQA